MAPRAGGGVTSGGRGGSGGNRPNYIPPEFISKLKGVSGILSIVALILGDCDTQCVTN